MKHTKSKTRSRLTDCHLGNSLRVTSDSDSDNYKRLPMHGLSKT